VLEVTNIFKGRACITVVWGVPGGMMRSSVSPNRGAPVDDVERHMSIGVRRSRDVVRDPATDTLLESASERHVLGRLR
jgi:hypothetical protein